MQYKNEAGAPCDPPRFCFPPMGGYGLNFGAGTLRVPVEIKRPGISVCNSSLHKSQPLFFAFLFSIMFNFTLHGLNHFTTEKNPFKSWISVINHREIFILFT